jgi:hypothetical protein
MRNVTKKTLWACCVGFAAATALVSGTAVANAAPASPAAQRFFHPTGKPRCNPWQLERWNLNGSNEVVAVYGGSNYTYSVTFKQKGSCLGGTLTDSYPGGATGPISGTVNGDNVTFSFTYPSTVQGTRTYTGTITEPWAKSGLPAGTVQGTWTQTGTQVANNLPWSLKNPAALACPKIWQRFTPVCPVR